MDPTRAEECGSDCEETAPSLIGLLQKNEADLSSFVFTSSDSLQHPPPPSSPRRQLSRMRSRDSLSEIRKPVKYLKCLLSQNIDRAFRVNSDQAGGGRWVRDVCVRRDFAENMVWDRTSFHGVGFSQEYEEYDDNCNTLMKSC